MNRFLPAILAGIAMVSCLGCTSGSTKENWTKEELSLIRSEQDTMYVLSIDVPEDSVILRTPSGNLSAAMLSSDDYNLLAEKMLATVNSEEHAGVGIAGPQVGILRRVVAVMRYDKEGRPFEVFPNIRITAFNGEKKCGPEGCLSVPGKRGDVARYRDIEIAYTSPATLSDTTEKITGYTAVIFQHECDHLDGVIYTDKLE